MTNVSFKVNLFDTSRHISQGELLDLMKACFGDLCKTMELHVELEDEKLEPFLSGSYCLRMS